MIDHGCPFTTSDDAIVRFVAPLFCIFFQIARTGYDVGAALGIPDWLSFFSPPDLRELWIFEGGLFLLVVATIPVLAFANMAQGLRWNWRTDFRLARGIGFVAWLEMCLVSPSLLVRHKVLENPESADKHRFSDTCALRSCASRALPKYLDR